MEKFTGIKKAVGDFNGWQGAARIYLNRDTGNVWTNIYTAPGWWNVYHDTAITQIASKATCVMYERDNKITVAKLKEICADELLKYCR